MDLSALLGQNYFQARHTLIESLKHLCSTFTWQAGHDHVTPRVYIRIFRRLLIRRKYDHKPVAHPPEVGAVAWFERY